MKEFIYIGLNIIGSLMIWAVFLNKKQVDLFSIEFFKLYIIFTIAIALIRLR